jgi:hypothetical protein
MTRSRLLRTRAALFALVAAAALSACGDDRAPSAPPGSAENPLMGNSSAAPPSAGRSNEAAAGAEGEGRQPGYEQLVAQQSRKPARRFTPCNLVTSAQARAIFGGPIEQPFEAPQGPTCIYRSQDGESFVTLAVQSLDFDQLKPKLQQRRRVDASDRTAYCGHFGQEMLYVPLARRSVLSVAAPCSLARQFAAKAVQRLDD